MPNYRKLNRKGYVRKSMLKGMTSTLLVEGSIVTTVARAKEIQQIAEKLIHRAILEKDNFTTREIKVSAAKLDDKGRKVLQSKDSKRGTKYDVVERVTTTKTVQVDDPSRLAARRLAMRKLVNVSDEYGQKHNTVNYLFDTLAPHITKSAGGYTSIIKLGPRRGDGSEMALLRIDEHEALQETTEDEKKD